MLHPPNLPTDKSDDKNIYDKIIEDSISHRLRIETHPYRTISDTIANYAIYQLHN